MYTANITPDEWAEKATRAHPGRSTTASSAWNKDSPVPHFMRFDRRRIERVCFTGWPAFLFFSFFLSLWKKEQKRGRGKS